MVQPFGGDRAHDEEAGHVVCPCCEEPYNHSQFDQEWVRTWVPKEDVQAYAFGPRWADWKPVGWKRGGTGRLAAHAVSAAGVLGGPSGGRQLV